jgi:hypothetical protein
MQLLPAGCQTLGKHKAYSTEGCPEGRLILIAL